MRIIILCLFSAFLWLPNTVNAQTTRASEKTETQNQGQVNFSKKKKKKGKKNKVTFEEHAISEYEELMKANKKKYHKMAKDMEKPQYSDPAYFGHKRPPKKRKLGKRKFCKECGMIH